MTRPHSPISKARSKGYTRNQSRRPTETASEHVFRPCCGRRLERLTGFLHAAPPCLFNNNGFTVCFHWVFNWTARPSWMSPICTKNIFPIAFSTAIDPRRHLHVQHSLHGLWLQQIQRTHDWSPPDNDSLCNNWTTACMTFSPLLHLQTNSSHPGRHGIQRGEKGWIISLKAFFSYLQNYPFSTYI